MKHSTPKSSVSVLESAPVLGRKDNMGVGAGSVPDSHSASVGTRVFRTLSCSSAGGLQPSLVGGGVPSSWRGISAENAWANTAPSMPTWGSTPSLRHSAWNRFLPAKYRAGVPKRHRFSTPARWLPCPSRWRERSWPRCWLRFLVMPDQLRLARGRCRAGPADPSARSACRPSCFKST